MYVYIYICIHVYIHIYIYIYIHMSDIHTRITYICWWGLYYYYHRYYHSSSSSYHYHCMSGGCHPGRDGRRPPQRPQRVHGPQRGALPAAEGALYTSFAIYNRHCIKHCIRALCGSMYKSFMWIYGFII